MLVVEFQLEIIESLTCEIFFFFCERVFLSFVGKYAQVTNHPENDGCINAVLLV